MTQTAQMILNDLQISPSIQEKISLIKNSKLNFEDFNNFRLLINSLENFEPNSNLSLQTQKNQINNKISSLIKNLEAFENKIKQEQQEQEKIVNLNPQNETNTLESGRSRFFTFMKKIDEISSKEFAQDKDEIGNLFNEVNHLLINGEDLGLSDNEIKILEAVEERIKDIHFFLQNQNDTENNISTNANESKENQNLKDLPLNDKELSIKEFLKDNNVYTAITELYKTLNHPLNQHDRDNSSSLKVEYKDLFFEIRLRKVAGEEQFKEGKFDYEIKINQYNTDKLSEIKKLNNIALAEELNNSNTFSVFDFTLGYYENTNPKQFFKDLIERITNREEKEKILNDKNYKPQTYFYDEKTQILSVKKNKTKNNNIEDFDYKLPIDKNGNYDTKGLIGKKEPEQNFFTSEQTISFGSLVDCSLEELIQNNISLDEIKDLIQKAKDENNQKTTQDTLFSKEELGLNSARKHKK